MLRLMPFQSLKSPQCSKLPILTRSSARCLVSFGKSTSKVRKHQNDPGIEAEVTKKVKDPDNELMKLWKSSESYKKGLIQKAVFGKKARKSRKLDRHFKVINLPQQSELTNEQAEELAEDSDEIGYRVPKIKEIVPTLRSSKLNDVDEEPNTAFTIGKFGQTCFPQSQSTFEDLGVHFKLIAKLEKLGITKAVDIQQRSLPLIYDNKSVLIKSETGSGKTLVFLLPTVQDPGRCFGTVIIVPTRELASQMLCEAHRLLADKSIVASFVSGIDQTNQEKRLQNLTNPPRIVIGTPKRLLEITEEHEALFHRTKRIVVDEVDKIFLPLHKRASRKKMIGRAVHPRAGHLLVEKIAKLSKIPDKQFIGASATVDSNLLEELSDVGWGDHVTVIQSHSYEGKLHSIPSCIEHRYTLFNESMDLSKANILARTFAKSDQKSALVFIHRNQSVDDFVWELRYLGLQAVALYKKIATQNPSSHEMFLDDFELGKFQLVVATEETVRGLDFKELENVYLMDVAKNVEEYLHLAGRVGRQGRKGTATTIVSGDKATGEERRILLQYRRLGVPFKEV